MTGVAVERTTLHPMPRWGAAFREQLAVTGLALWREGVVLLAFLLVAASQSIAESRVIAERWRTNGTLAEHEMLAAIPRQFGIEVFGSGPVTFLAIAALFLPAAVWRGTSATGRGYLRAMPLPQAQHALVKVAAGWVWAMLGVAAFSVGMGIVAAVAAQILGDTPVAVHPRGRTTDVWVWLVPFTGVTVTYLVGSAFALAARHPWRVVLTTFVGSVAYVYLMAFTVGERAIDPLGAVFTGRLGLNGAIAGVEMVQRTFALDRGQMTTSMTVPAFDRWMPAVLLWLALSLAAVALAARRRN